MILQVSTNEEDTPWDPDPKDQKVDRKNYKAGVERLQRDVLRFLDLIPDIEMNKVRIATNLAPLYDEDVCHLLCATFQNATCSEAATSLC